MIFMNLKSLLETGYQRNFTDVIQAFPRFNEFLSDVEYTELEKKYTTESDKKRENRK